MSQISILLSALNAENTLPQALDSLRSQTFMDWECYLINDGSTDGTGNVLERYRREDSRFHILSHEKPHGLTASLIEASRLVQSPFLARHDADDWSESQRLEDQIAYLKSHLKSAVVGCDFAIHDDAAQFLDTVRPFHNPFWIKRSLRHRNPFAHGSLLFRRDAFEKCGGYRREFIYAQDYDLLLRLSEGNDLGCVPLALYHHRLSESGIGRAKRSMQSAYAALALKSAASRSKGQVDLIPTVHLDEIDNGPLTFETVDPILLHLIKSVQKNASSERLAQWHPKGFKARLAKSALWLLNASPVSARQTVHSVYRLWQLR